MLTIECAEELFLILYILNITQPKHILDEIKFDHRLTGYSYEQNKKAMTPQMHFEAFNQLADQSMRIKKTIDEAMKIKTLTGEEQRGMDSTETN